MSTGPDRCHLGGLTGTIRRILEEGVDLLSSGPLSLLALDIVGYLHGVRFGCRGRDVESTANFLINVARNEAGENPLKLFVCVRA